MHKLENEWRFKSHVALNERFTAIINVKLLFVIVHKNSFMAFN